MTKSLRATLCGLRVERARSRARRIASRAQRDAAPGRRRPRGRAFGTRCRSRTACCSTPDHPLVALDDRGRVAGVGRVHAGEQVAQRVQHHVGLAERRQHLADVAQEGRVRADDEDAAALEGAAVGVEQVGGAVQRGDGLAGAGAALHDQHPRQVGADHPVLLGLDGGDDVGHPAGARARDRRDQRRLAGQGRPVAVGQLVEVEDLVVDAGHLAEPGVDVPPPDEPLRAARRGGIERPRGRRPPVD